MDENNQFIEDMFRKGILLNREVLDKKIDESILERLEHEGDLIVLNSDYVEVIAQPSSLVDWYELDSSRVELEKERDEELYQTQLQTFKTSSLLLHTPGGSHRHSLSSLEAEITDDDGVQFSSSSFSSDNPDTDSLLEQTEALSQPLVSSLGKVEIVISYQNVPRKYEVKDFTAFFISRYRFLEGLLRNRQEMQNAMAISRILSKKDKENVAVIGLIDNIGETKNGSLMLTVEDPTGKIKVFISPQKKELLQKAKDLVYDEVVGISGTCGDKIIFADDITWPDIPATNELKKGNEEEYAVFLSDIHVGSNLFLRDEFEKFLRWIRGEAGSEEQRRIAGKVRYLIIAGDLVDGIGIYPSQASELDLKDIIQQYDEFCSLIKRIPGDKQIIICPGNHDAVHLAEPQSSFDEKFASPLFKMPNVSLVTNPALVNIGKTEKFPGFDILLYHGYSFDYYVANVESIRNQGGYHRADLIMRFLLKRRHLAPSFRSTPYFPGHTEDPLLIRKIPDFLISGHIHYSKVANYRGVTTICGSCWQGKTSFQEKLGHEPEPARVPIVNLKTREVKVLKFG